MAAFANKYYFYDGINFSEYMFNIAGLDGAEAARKLQQYESYLEVAVSGDNYTFIVYNGEEKITNTFKLNEEFDCHTFGNKTYKTIVSKYDNVFKIISKVSHNNSFIREYKFSNGKVEIFFSDELFGITAVLWFERHY